MNVFRTFGTFALAATLAMPLATSAFAQRDRDWHHDNRGHYDRHDRDRGHGGNGAAIGGALLGLGIGALIGGAIASGPPAYAAPPPVYYAPPPSYGSPPPPPAYYGYR
jgi:hypothetical protein